MQTEGIKNSSSFFGKIWGSTKEKIIKTPRKIRNFLLRKTVDITCSRALPFRNAGKVCTAFDRSKTPPIEGENNKRDPKTKIRRVEFSVEQEPKTRLQQTGTAITNLSAMFLKPCVFLKTGLWRGYGYFIGIENIGQGLGKIGTSIKKGWNPNKNKAILIENNIRTAETERNFAANIGNAQQGQIHANTREDDPSIVLRETKDTRRQKCLEGVGDIAVGTGLCIANHYILDYSEKVLNLGKYCLWGDQGKGGLIGGMKHYGNQFKHSGSQLLFGKDGQSGLWKTAQEQGPEVIYSAKDLIVNNRITIGVIGGAAIVLDGYRKGNKKEMAVGTVIALAQPVYEIYKWTTQNEEMKIGSTGTCINPDYYFTNQSNTS